MRGRKKTHRLLAAVEALERRWVLSAPPLPSITGPTFNITNYGAVADGTTDNTSAIQNCINAAAADAANSTDAGGTLVGAVVEVPAASLPFESGPLVIPSNIDLQIDSGGELQMLPYGRYDTSAPSTTFLTFNHATNVELTGSGTIDGQGAAWWAAFNANSSVQRPFMIKFNTCNTVLVDGVTLQNGPTEHLTFSASTNVTIDNVTVNAPADSPNTDGMDPAGTNFLIENCTVSDGDDDIVMKPQNTFCSNITVTHCTINSGHGLSIGGETNDGLNGMEIDNITFNGTIAGIRLKAERGEGGTVQNVVVNDVTMTNVQYPININSYYNIGSVPSNPQDPTQALTALTPVWENISFNNVTATITKTDSNYSNSYAGIIWGLPEAPVVGVTMTNVNLQGKYGMDLDHARGVTFDASSSLTALNGGPVEISTKSVNTPYDAEVTQAGWTDQDTGAPTVTGGSIFNPDTSGWTVDGGGNGIGGNSDQFNLASQILTGNGGIVAKVSSSSAAQAGVMVRASLAAGAAFAATLITPSGGVEFQWRSATGATVQTDSISGYTAPIYLELVRQGNSFSGYFSTDDATWTRIGAAQTVTMSASALDGLAVSSASVSAASTATFTNVSGPPTSITSSAQGEFASGQFNTFLFTAAGTPTPDVSISGALPAGVRFHDNNNGTATLSGTPLADGLYVLTVSASNGSTSSEQVFTLDVADAQAPAVYGPKSLTLTVGETGWSMSALVALGFPTPTLTVSGTFPAGIEFDDSEPGIATFVGSPGEGTDGIHKLTIHAGNVSSPFTLTIGEAPAFTSASSASFTAGTAGSFAIAITGYPKATVTESGSLPAGLSFKSTPGGAALYGKPSAASAGTYILTLSARNAFSTSVTQTFTLTVQSAITAHPAAASSTQLPCPQIQPPFSSQFDSTNELTSSSDPLHSQITTDI